MKKKIFLLTLSMFLLCGCGKIPKLENGQDAFITFKNGDKISVDEVYGEIKNDFALQAAVNLMDKKILEKEFKNEVKNAEVYAKNTIDSMKESYGGSKELLQAIQYYAGYSSIEAYQDYIYLNYLQNIATEQYAKESVSEKNVKKYYENSYFGDISINHILITPDVKSNASDEEIKKAEEKAKKQAENIIKELDKAKKDKKDVNKTFTELAKKYSDDESTKNDSGKLGYININSLGSNYDELVKSATKLKNKSYSTSVITTELGYHVIYRVDQKDKKSLKDAESEIREILSKKTLEQDSTILAKALKSYREKYGVEIVDSEIKKQYNEYMEQQLSQVKSEEN